MSKVEDVVYLMFFGNVLHIASYQNPKPITILQKKSKTNYNITKVIL